MTIDTLPKCLLQSPVCSEMPTDYVVQKFGGTSLGKFPLNIVNNVVIPSTSNRRIVVVCSARSINAKTDGTTNRLLRAARDTRNPYSSDYKVLVHIVQAEHIQAAQGYIRSAKITHHLVREIQEECSQVVKLLEAAQTLGEITPRCMDRVISTGEKLSCRFLSALLCDRGVSSAYVDLSEAVDLSASNVIDRSYYDTLTASIGRKIQECESRVPVVTGYFGIVPGGLLQKIGRGYTDLCAALVAVGISATELQIWKEVDGIFTANPKVVPTAKLLSTITPAEASELTFYGSEVIHPFAMKQVMRARIPIRIAGVMNPRGSGTIVLPERLPRPETGFSTRKSKLIRSRASEELFNHRNPRKPTAVTTKDNILVINVYSTERSLSHSFFARIFDVLDKWKLSVDLMATSEVQVSMALHSEAPLLSGSGDDDYQIVNQDLYGAIHELCSYGCVDLIPGMTILSLVGKEMKNMTGIAGSMFFTLGENDIDIEMISQGASSTNISCVIDERDAERAISIIHASLFNCIDEELSSVSSMASSMASSTSSQIISQVAIRRDR